MKGILYRIMEGVLVIVILLLIYWGMTHDRDKPDR